jgi:hypothetical protein
MGSWLHYFHGWLLHEPDEGCGPIFSMNTAMGVKITCETLMNSPTVPLLPMQHISTSWIFATPHTCACSHQPRSSLQSTNSQWNDRLHMIFRIEITGSQQSGERKILQIKIRWNIYSQKNACSNTIPEFYDLIQQPSKVMT